MNFATPARFVSALTCLALVAPPPAFASRTIRCESDKYRYHYCRVETDNRVELTRQLSNTRCRQGDNWGYDRRGVWVDRGCGAGFRVGRDGGSSSSHAAAAVAGIAAIAAIAAIASQANKDSDVASWAVGTFRGYDDREGTDVELTILPGGSVSGRAGRHDFDGSLNGDRLTAGNKVFRIERADNGFVGTEERDRYRVHFRRSGSGY